MLPAPTVIVVCFIRGECDADVVILRTEICLIILCSTRLILNLNGWIKVNHDGGKSLKYLLSLTFSTLLLFLVAFLANLFHIALMLVFLVDDLSAGFSVSCWFWGKVDPNFSGERVSIYKDINHHHMLA